MSILTIQPTLPATVLSKSRCPFGYDRAESVKTPLKDTFVDRKSGKKSDADVLVDVEDWMRKKLPCVAGRREFNRGRYHMEIARKETVPSIFERFKKRLAAGQSVACLYIFNSEDFAYENASTSEAFYFLADQMSPISTMSAHALANGAPLTNEIELTCPVTNLVTTYDDFECIAFCPQSADESDILYDPLMAMPYPAVNMSSDMFAFSRFVADSVESVLKRPAYAVEDHDELEDVMHRCVERWQRVATTTITNYEALTDTTLCPIHLSEDQETWIAGHKDPAFAEQCKEVHEHELPVKYGNRIVDNWMQYFRGEKLFSASGLARDGIAVG